MNKEGQENMSDNDYFEPEKRLPPDEMPLPPIEPIKADNPMERLIVLLATAFSAFIAILDILGIEFFKGTKQTGDILIIALCIPLVLIVLFNHLYRQIISIFLLCWGIILIYKWIYKKDDVEPLLLIGILAVAVYFILGFILRFVVNIVNLVRYPSNRTFNRLIGGSIIIVFIIAFLYYLSNERLWDEARQFIHHRIENIKYWVVSNHLRNTGTGQWQVIPQQIEPGKSFTGNSGGIQSIDRYYGPGYKDSIYLYFVLRNDELPTLHLVVNYMGKRRNIKSFSVKADGNIILDIPGRDINYQRVFIWRVGTYDCQVSSREFEIINLILKSGQCAIVYRGEADSHTHLVTAREKQELGKILNVFKGIWYVQLIRQPFYKGDGK